MTYKTIKIEKVIHTGLGLARQDNGLVIQVRQVLPGETVIPKIIERKKQYLLAIPEKIVTAHDERIEPPCPYYTLCGGCDFQHASYELQLRMKRDILADLFCRKFPMNTSQLHELIEDTLPSPLSTHYRQRIRLQSDKTGRLGFNRYRSHDIVVINNCLLADNVLNISLKAILKDPAAEILLTNCQEIEFFLNPPVGTVIVCLHYKRRLRPTDKKSAELLTKNIPTVVAVFFKGDDFPITGPFTSHTNIDSAKMFHYSIPVSSFLKTSVTLTWEVGSFSQVNLAQNIRLIELVLQYCDAKKSDRILDLFCGMGNFSIPLAFNCHLLLAVEAQRSAIRSAKKNAFAAGLENITFVQSNVFDHCQQLLNKREQFDIVIIDPPRQGVSGLAEIIASLTIKKIVYISCDPATLCRDLEELTTLGLFIKKIKPVDMFPQTHHIETVVLLEK